MLVGQRWNRSSCRHQESPNDALSFRPFAICLAGSEPICPPFGALPFCSDLTFALTASRRPQKLIMSMVRGMDKFANTSLIQSRWPHRLPVASRWRAGCPMPCACRSSFPLPEPRARCSHSEQASGIVHPASLDTVVLALYESQPAVLLFQLVIGRSSTPVGKCSDNRPLRG